MRRGSIFKRLLSLILVISMVAAFLVPVNAVSSGDYKITKVDNSNVSIDLKGGNTAADQIEEEIRYKDTDIVRVSIVLEKDSTIEAGFSTENIAGNKAAMTYRQSLKKEQESITAQIEKVTSEKLDTVWNLTLAANIISANVQYGQIEKIEKVAGVKEVVIENRYDPAVVGAEKNDPNMGTSSSQIGSTNAWLSGYTGAGMQLAVIDTGIDYEHKSFDGAALEYSLKEKYGEDYAKKLNLLTKEKIKDVAEYLNANTRADGLDVDKVYISTKIPFGYNYVDSNYTIDHLHDAQGEHGSHVEGISAANKYVPNGDGTFSEAVRTVKMQGVAPDAQIVAMKVFGAKGGAYDSDYMAAIEDAIVLEVASVNLSLGSGNPGNSHAGQYQGIMESLAEHGTVVTMSAGNAYSWANSAVNGVGYLYSSDVSMDMAGSPGSFTNSLGVASINNDGTTANFVVVGGNAIFYVETSAKNLPFTTIAGEREYVFIDGVGTEDDFAAVADVLEGKIALCSRGETSFYQKAEAAVKYGAIATIIYNNQDGTISMDLSDYTKTQPCVSITQADGAAIKAASEQKTSASGATYYAGTMVVMATIDSVNYNSKYYTMSDFSSWGVPGSLTLKPEITAPGGNIYSVWGANTGSDGPQEAHDKYENMSGTSMAAPQVNGMATLIAQYIKENDLVAKTGMSARQLAQSLLMSTSVPVMEDHDGEGDGYYSILKQGSGLANVGNAVSAASYITMDPSSTKSAADGKVKAELGDDPGREGEYSWTFNINDLSGKDQRYTLDTDLFTQDLFPYNGQVYMDTWTTPLSAIVSYSVNGVAYDPMATTVDADMDKDGDTDINDARAILSYITGENNGSKYNLTVADVDKDGKITSYDAYLILENLEKVQIVVPANGSVSVTVNAVLLDKDYLDENYEGGAYVEGFTFVKPVVTAEGGIGVTHSIPVLGFYGSWTDASMFESVSAVDAYYGTNTKAPYTYTGTSHSNYLTVKYTENGAAQMYYGNPYSSYVKEEKFPADRLAVSSNTVVYQANYRLIRNAAVNPGFVTEDGRVLYAGTGTGSVAPGSAPYYYVNGGAWQGVAFRNATINKSFASVGAKEGEKVTFGLFALPEYYAEDGVVDFNAALASGTVGDGAVVGYTAVVDNKAPELFSVSKTTHKGELVIGVQDDNYVAAIMIMNATGTKVLASVLPEQENAGKKVVTTFDLSDIRIGKKCLVVVGDYAGNESTYLVEDYDPDFSYQGTMLAFTSSTYFGGTGNRWIEIDPEAVQYTSTTNYAGVATFDSSNVAVRAAEYVKGYIFMAGTDGNLYAAPLENLASAVKVGKLSSSNIYDMAYNTADGKLYALDGSDTSGNNKIYSVDLATGELTLEYTVTITNPKSTSNTYKKLVGLAIDDDGAFYAVNYGTGTYAYLYKWTSEDVADGAVSDLAPVNNTSSGTTGYYAYNAGGALAWDHTNKVLYQAVHGSTSTTIAYNANNYLLVLDTETGKGVKANTNGTYGGRLYAKTTGLIIVPDNGDPTLAPAANATGIEVSKTSLDMLTGSANQVSATVYPWNLADKSVTWTTSDANVVTVTDGFVVGKGAGTATITVSSNATPSVTATIAVTVTDVPESQMTGLIYGVDGKANWSDFSSKDPAGATYVADGGTYIAGALVGDTIYVHDGGNLYAVDADTFEVTTLGGIASSWCYSDAAPVPAAYQAEYGGKLFAPCMDGTYMEILDPEAGSLSYWNGIATYYSNDNLATIAYVGETTYNGNAALAYYALTENGELWRFILFNGSSLNRTDLGNTGLVLGDVSSNSGIYASMNYDPETGFLYVASYQDGETAQMYAINPATLQYAVTGEFGDEVWPAVALYQYNRITELTLFLSESEHNMYVGGSFELTAKVKPASYTGGVIWTSSNPEVASVDNGVVTALAVGTTTITVTTVDKDAEGNSLTATCVVTVKDKISVDATIGSQIVTGGEGVYVDIDLKDLSMTTTATAPLAYDAGGMAGGTLYGTVEGWVVEAMTLSGYDFSSYANYIPRDITNFPAFGDFTNRLIYPSTTQYLITFDFEAGSLSSWNLTGLNLVACSFIGILEDDDGTNLLYFALGADGTLYLMYIYPGSSAGSLSLSRGPLGNIGRTFSDPDAVTMGYYYDGKTEGLVIADGATMELFWIADPSDAETFEAAALGELDADYVSSFYGRFETYASVDANPNLVMKLGARGERSKTVPMGLAMDALTAKTIKLGETANASIGSTNAIRATADLNAIPVVDKDANDFFTVSLTEDEDVTNGKITVSYDPEALSFIGVKTNAEIYSVNAANGTVTFAYAGSEAIAAGNVIATVYFERISCGTTVTVATNERNDDVDVQDDVVTLTLEHKYEVEITDPTCTEKGYTTYTCSVCGDSYITDEVEALGHDYQAVVTMPNISTQGYTTHTCSRCGDSYVDSYTNLFTRITNIEDVKKGGHFILVVKDGRTGAYKALTAESVNAAPHFGVTEVSAVVMEYAIVANSDDVSKLVWTAESICDGLTFTNGEFAIGNPNNGTGFSNENSIWNIAAGSAANTFRFSNTVGKSTRTIASENGYNYFINSSRTTGNYVADIMIFGVADGNTHTDHNFGDWIETKAPTCTEKGEETRICSVCGAKETREVAATGHSTETELKNAKPATCTEDGYTGDKVCKICGEVLEAGEVINATGHSFGDWTETKAPTCTEKGEETRTCAACGEKETREVAAKGHNYESTVVAPTCTEHGYTKHVCKTCGDIYYTDYTDPTGHSTETELKNAKAATCTEDGYTGDKVCKVCGEVVEAGEVIKATGHNFGDWTETKAPSCTEKGEETRTCATCGEKETREVAATGHSAETELKNAKPATCTEDGYTGDKVCKTCGEVVEAGEVIKATGHSTELKNAKAATCTEDGYTGDKVCKTCGEVVEAGEVIKATGHEYESVVTKPTATKKGYTTHTCKNCGHSYVDSYTDPSDNSNTGDSFNAALVVLAMTASAMALAVLVIFDKKNRKHA